jgi:hypothetical protein
MLPFWANFIFSKSHNELLKVAQSVLNHPKMVSYVSLRVLYP